MNENLLSALIVIAIPLLGWGLFVLAARITEYREDRAFAKRTDAMFAAAMKMPVQEFHQHFGKSTARFLPRRRA